MKNNKHLKVLGVKEEPLIEDLEKTRFTPEEKEVTKEGIMPHNQPPIMPPMKEDKLLNPDYNLLPQQKQRKEKPYLARLAEEVG